MDYLKRKGQVGFEALIAFAILSLIFVFSFTVYLSREREISWSTDFLDAKKECYKISSLISRVRANGKGFVDRADFDTYTLHVDSDLRTVTVLWDDSSTFCSLSTVNVTNATHSKFNVFGEYIIRNDGTNVVFKKV